MRRFISCHPPSDRSSGRPGKLKAVATLLAAALACGQPGPSLAFEPEAPRPPPAAKPAPAKAASGGRDASVERELCAVVESAARENSLPIEFFTRLLWKESRFRSGAVSPKGAQGIAQFMPGTAAERGLLDPFDPLQAIPASARLLRDLRAQFGNLGLAAAAYNAGAGRVTNWTAGLSSLPYETQDYVLSITGEPAEVWASPELGAAAAAKPATEKSCVELAGTLRVRGTPAGPALATAHGPWGVQVAGNFSQARALASYQRLQKQFPGIIGGKPPMIIRNRIAGRGSRTFYRVRVPAQSREAAIKLCLQLRSVGGPCAVMKT